MNLAVCQTCWQTGSSGASSIEPASDDFHLGEALFVAKLVELVDQLGDLLLDLELDLFVAIDFVEHGLVLLVELDFRAMVVDVLFGFVERDVDAVQELGAIFFGELGFDDLLPRVLENLERLTRLLLAQVPRFGLLFADFGGHLASQDLLIFGRGVEQGRRRFRFGLVGRDRGFARGHRLQMFL